jgi:nitrate/nitrite-specific signal transduction histidine kinase
MEGVKGEIQQMWFRDLFITWGGIVVLILFLFLLVEHNIIIPIKEIVSTCKKVRKGDLKSKIKNIPKTEIGEFADTFNKTVEDLRKSKDALEESEAILKIKVRARTRELEELTENLEDKVKERTKELEERIKELERFHKITVGREMKMIELKEELKKLKTKKKKNESGN